MKLEIKKSLKNIFAFCSLFGRELTMSVSSWSSGNCTVTNSSKYLAYILMQDGYPIIAVRDGTRIVGTNVTQSNGTQYVRTFSATTSDDVWTMAWARQLTHNATGNHSGNTGQAITKVVGLVPIVGGVVRRLFSLLTLERGWAV